MQDLFGRVDESFDMLETAETAPESVELANFRALVWRDPHKRGSRSSFPLQSVEELNVGDTLVVRDTDPKWNGLDRVGPNPSLDLDEKVPPVFFDVAESAFRQVRAKEVLRLRPALFRDAPPGSAFSQLLAWAIDPNTDWRLQDIYTAFSAATREIAADGAWLNERRREVGNALGSLRNPKCVLRYEAYPDGSGMLLRTRCRVRRLKVSEALPPFDEGEDDPSRADRQPVSIIDHTADVKRELERRVTICHSTRGATHY